MKSRPARSDTAPLPTAETIPLFTVRSSPAKSETDPLPPVAATFAAIVRSVVVEFPSAANVMSPPPAFVTSEFTLSGLPPSVVMQMSSPTAPPVMLAPTVAPIVVIVSPPAVSIRPMSPVIVVAARFVALISILAALPIPLTATSRMSSPMTSASESLPDSSIAPAETSSTSFSAPALMRPTTMLPEVVVRLMSFVLLSVAELMAFVAVIVPPAVTVIEPLAVSTASNSTALASFRWISPAPVTLTSS